MSDLTPVGEILVSAEAQWLSSDQMLGRYHEILTELKRDRDEGDALLQMSWLCRCAIERLSHMEESHAGHPDRRERRGSDPLRRDLDAAVRASGSRST